MFIGGGTVQYPDIDDDIPGWLLVVGDALMILALMGKALVSVPTLGLTQELTAAEVCALLFGATFALSYLVGTYVLGPAIGLALVGVFGNTVAVTTGCKLLQGSGETDFVLPA